MKRISATILLLTLTIAAWAQPTSTIHKQMPTKFTFGSSDQWKALKSIVKQKEYAAVLLTWKTELLPDRRSALIWDSKNQVMYRIHSDGRGNFERWGGVSRDKIRASGEEIPLSFAYTSGSGKMFLSEAAEKLLKKAQ